MAISVPPDIVDTRALRRFLEQVASSLNALRSGSTESDLASIDSVSQSVTILSESLNQVIETTEYNEDAIKVLKTRQEELTYIDSYSAGASTYNDFNDAVWAQADSHVQFSALGSALTNTPFTPVGANTYTVYLDHTKTLGGGAKQTIFVEDSGGPSKVYVRCSDTSAGLLTNSWLTL